MKNFFNLFYIILCCSTTATYAADVSKLNLDEVAYYVQDLVTGEIIAEHRADVAMNPASTMKLVTTFAGLKKLGADYRWKTQWVTDGYINNKQLIGDLYWKGSGNPVFDQQDLVLMQQQLIDQGIENISGNVVLDTSLWNNLGTADDFASDAKASFTTAPHPHMLAYKVVRVEAKQQENGVTLELDPPFTLTKVNLKINPSKAKKCTNLKPHLNYKLSNNELNIIAKLSKNCVGKETYINILDFDSYVKESFIGQWHKQGMEGPNHMVYGQQPTQAQVLAEHYSRPLKDIIKDMNKYSNNIIARMLFLRLGQDHISQDQDTIQNALQYVRAVFNHYKIDSNKLILENGSGLSRQEQITARNMGALLEQAYYSDVRQPFIDSLPIGGVDGTLKTRFKKTPHLYLKTGTLKNVRSLAGYWLPEEEGQNPMVVVVFVNSPNALSQLREMDRLVESIIKPTITLNQ